jgi:hypothetical protein
MTGRYTGDLDKLRDHPNFSWSLGAMTTYLREMDLRAVDARIERAQRLIADGARHQDVMGALSAVENGLAKYPDLQPEQQAVTDAYAERYGLRGWYRYTSTQPGEEGQRRMYVNYIRTREDGDVGRYFASSGVAGGRYLDGSWVKVVDRDSHKVVASFGVGEPKDVAFRKARSWIYTTESGGC